jgi:hypothetical protein
MRAAAQTFDKDYDILIQGRQADREAIDKMGAQQRYEQEQFDRFSETLQEGMNKFQNLDIAEQDRAGIEKVEKEARKQIQDMLRKHGGDPRAFMRSGGKAALSKYYAQVVNSREYETAIANGQTYAMAANAIEKGEVPNHVNLGTPEEPKLVPFWQAVKMHERGELKSADGSPSAIPWSGAFKDLNLGELQQEVRFITPDTGYPRQATPKEVHGLALKRGVPEWRAAEIAQHYESVYYDPTRAATVSRKNPFSTGENRAMLDELRFKERMRVASQIAKERAEGKEPFNIAQPFFDQGQQKVQTYPIPNYAAPSLLGGMAGSPVKYGAMSSVIVEQAMGIPVGTELDMVFFDNGTTMEPLALKDIQQQFSFLPNLDAITSKAKANGEKVVKQKQNIGGAIERYTGEFREFTPDPSLGWKTDMPNDTQGTMRLYKVEVTLNPGAMTNDKVPGLPNNMRFVKDKPTILTAWVPGSPNQWNNVQYSEAAKRQSLQRPEGTQEAGGEDASGVGVDELFR